jgi:hypothetical protein
LKYCGITSPSRSFETLVHFVQHRNQADGINVEHRLRKTFDARERMIAGHGQNTVKPFAVQEPSFALQAVAIEVLAGEMNDDFLAGIQDGFT